MPATTQDAEMILRLYDLRRETEMRKARDYVGLHCWPQSYADIEKAVYVPFSDENRYFRQVLSFWDMAATMVLHGAINDELFIDTADEMFFVYAKMKPFLAEIREKTSNPMFLVNVEKIATRTRKGEEKARLVEQRVQRVGKMLAEKRAQAAKG